MVRFNNVDDFYVYNLQGENAVAGTVSREKQRPVADPSSMTLSETRVLEQVEAINNKDGTYFKAYIQKSSGLLITVGDGMNYEEAYVYLLSNKGTKILNNLYGKQNGIYTENQADAWALAQAFGAPNQPEVHGINFFGHYHDLDHQDHIWFGNPILIFSFFDLLGACFLYATLIWRVEVFKNEDFFILRDYWGRRHKIRYSDCTSYQYRYHGQEIIIRNTVKNFTVTDLLINCEVLLSTLRQHKVKREKDR